MIIEFNKACCCRQASIEVDYNLFESPKLICVMPYVKTERVVIEKVKVSLLRRKIIITGKSKRLNAIYAAIMKAGEPLE